MGLGAGRDGWREWEGREGELRWRKRGRIAAIGAG